MTDKNMVEIKDDICAFAKQMMPNTVLQPYQRRILSTLARAPETDVSGLDDLYAEIIRISKELAGTAKRYPAVILCSTESREWLDAQFNARGLIYKTRKAQDKCRIFGIPLEIRKIIPADKIVIMNSDDEVIAIIDIKAGGK